MKRVIVYLVAGALVVVGVLLSARPLRERFTDLRSDLAKVGADTGDVMSSASYQRHQARREAVFAMQEELRSLARAESAFVADSGRPTALLPPAYPFRKGAGNVGPYIRIERKGWSAMITNSRTSMRCTLFASLDTVSNTYHPGQPDCRSESGEAWDSVAAAQAASRPPEPPLPDPPPAPPPAPRKHRDWGPVNNTPPPTPWIVRDVCPGEYCSLGRWAACSTVTAYREKRLAAARAFTASRGEALTALKGDMHVDVPGMVVFRETTSNPGIAGDQVDSIQFTPADTLYLLDETGEGYLNWWFRERAAIGYAFWNDTPEASDSVALVRRTRSVWWVRVRNAAGQEGWVQYDYRKFARDDRMDEIERCLP